MASCGIMRVEKRRVWAVGGLESEANRTSETAEKFGNSDIDISKTNDNIYLKRTDGWRTNINQLIVQSGLKARKNSIVMIDGLYTASPEFFKGKTNDEVKRYFKECLEFHVKEYCQGQPERLINAVIHLDETTPHMQVASVPIVEDEKGVHLSAKILMGTNRIYRERQDRFFEEVTKGWGLERGEVKKDSKEMKKHKEKREREVETLEKKLGYLEKELSSKAAEVDIVSKSLDSFISQHRMFETYEKAFQFKRAESVFDSRELGKKSFLGGTILSDEELKKVNEVFEKERQISLLSSKVSDNLRALKDELKNLKKYYQAVAKKEKELSVLYKKLSGRDRDLSEIKSLDRQKESLKRDIKHLEGQVQGLEITGSERAEFELLKAFAKDNEKLFDKYKYKQQQKDKEEKLFRR